MGGINSVRIVVMVMKAKMSEWVSEWVIKKIYVPRGDDSCMRKDTAVEHVGEPTQRIIEYQE